jgi:integrase
VSTIRKRTWKVRDVTRSAWVVDYCDQAGTRRLKTFNTKKEAEAWSVTALHEVKLGTHSAASASITVANCWDLWLDHCQAEGLEFGTIKQRRQHLNLHISTFIGAEKLSSLTTPRIHQFDGQLREAGRSLSMRRKVLTNLKTALTFAQGRGLVAQNVARGVKLKSEDGREAKGPLREGVDFPSRADLRLLTEAATGRWRPFLITAVFTGMRASELRGLAWADLDLEDGTIHVRRRADAWGTIGHTKSKMGKRDIPLPPIVINALKTWKSECPEGPKNLVFPNGAGNVESMSNIWQRFWEPLQLKCGLVRTAQEVTEESPPSPRYGFHSLRHAAASLFIAYLGWTPKRVQTVLGHSSITMTFDLYGHLFEDKDADRAAMRKIEAAIVAA